MNIKDEVFSIDQATGMDVVDNLAHRAHHAMRHPQRSGFSHTTAREYRIATCFGGELVVWPQKWVTLDGKQIPERLVNAVHFLPGGWLPKVETIAGRKLAA